MSEQEEDHDNWMMDRCNLFGQVGMILCWHWDGASDDMEGEEAVRGVRLLSKLLSGKTAKFSQNDWWVFCDALGAYPVRTPQLEEIYQIASEGVRGRNFGADTKSFMGDDDLPPDPHSVPDPDSFRKL